MKQVQGFSLIELLVAMIISSIIILSLMYVQLQQSQLVVNNQLRFIAIYLVDNSFEESYLGDNYVAYKLQQESLKLLPGAISNVSSNFISFKVNLKWQNKFGLEYSNLSYDV